MGGFDGNFVQVIGICDTIPETKQSFDLTRNWGDLRQESFEEFKVHPAALVLNYASSVFEGTKAFYSSNEGAYRLFRPKDHYNRFKASCERIALPAPTYERFCEALKAVIDKADRVEAPGFLYLRPVCMSRDPTLGASPPKNATFYAIGCIVSSPYFSGSAKLKLIARKDRVRAWPGGCGDIKFSGRRNKSYNNIFLSPLNVKGIIHLLTAS